MISGDTKLLHDTSVVSGLSKIQTKNAKYLSFNELLKNVYYHNDDIINIGTTYNFYNPEFVFYYKCSSSVTGVTIVSLFVRYTNQGPFTIIIPNEERLFINISEIDPKYDFSKYTIETYTFETKRCNEHKYIKSFNMPYSSDIEDLKTNISILLLPIKITTKPKEGLDPIVVKSIKYAHYKQNCEALKEQPCDFVLVSNNGNKHEFHKLILAAHSPVMKQLIKDSNTSELKVDTDDKNLEVLREFLYTGYVKEVVKYDALKILELADKYRFKNFCTLLQYPLVSIINTMNAIELGVLAHNYNLEHLQMNVFSFVKSNPNTLKVEYWKQVNDVDFIKKMFEFVHSSDN